MKRISIVTPSFNQGAYLEETIDSVLSQGYENLEYIVIDGGSTDNSLEIIKKHERHLAYWQSRNDKGQADAIAQGFMRSTGDILAWINSDDRYMPGTIKKVMQLFSANPQVDLLYGDYVLEFPDGRQIPKLKTSYDYRIYLSVYMMVPQPSSFWSQSIYKRVGGLDVNYHYAFDYEFFLKIGRALNEEIPKRTLHVHDLYSIFRIHEKSKSVSQMESFKPEIRSIRDKYGFPYRGINRKVRQYYQLLRLALQYHRERGVIPTKKDLGKA